MTPYARSVIVVLALASVLNGACAKSADDTSAAAPAAASTRPPVAVTTAPVQTGHMLSAVNVVGSLAPKFAADVKSEVSGTVTEVAVTEWVSVRKGQLLARLDTSEELGRDDRLPRRQRRRSGGKHGRQRLHVPNRR